MKKAFIIVGLAAFFALVVIHDRLGATRKTLHVQGIESVVSAQLIPAHAGSDSKTVSLDITNANDKEAISKVLKWLNSSQVVGDAKDHFVTKGGWQQEQSFTFTPEEAVAIVLKEHPVFPAIGEKQMYEEIGGIQGHKQEVTLTTKVEKRGLLNYVVTLTKDYNLNVGGKEAIQSWVYSVSPSNVTLISQQGNAPNIK